MQKLFFTDLNRIVFIKGRNPWIKRHLFFTYSKSIIKGVISSRKGQASVGRTLNLFFLKMPMSSGCKRRSVWIEINEKITLLTSVKLLLLKLQPHLPVSDLVTILITLMIMALLLLFSVASFMGHHSRSFASISSYADHPLLSHQPSARPPSIQ